MLYRLRVSIDGNRHYCVHSFETDNQEEVIGKIETFMAYFKDHEKFSLTARIEPVRSEITEEKILGLKVERYRRLDNDKYETVYIRRSHDIVERLEALTKLMKEPEPVETPAPPALDYEGHAARIYSFLQFDARKLGVEDTRIAKMAARGVDLKDAIKDPDYKQRLIETMKELIPNG